MYKLKDYFKSPQLILVGFLKHTARIWPLKFYLTIQFRMLVGYWPDLKCPRTFNEKLNWLKIYNRKPEYTQMADKYAVKQIVKEKIGEEYVVPCYDVWYNINDIDFEKLPYPVVLKTTGDSSSVFICKNLASLDIEAIRRRLNKALRRNFYYQGREWVYKNIRPLVIADKFLDDNSGHELLDYKFWCFNGEPRVMYITNKSRCIFENFYDMEFNPMDINHRFVRHKPEFSKPAKFELMKELCRKLLKGIDIPIIRIDFFYVNEKIYFGEFTFYDWAGMRSFINKEQDMKLGEMIELNIDNLD